MTTFLALYRGDSVASARLLALSVDGELVRDFASRLLQTPPDDDSEADHVLEELEDGRRRALRLVRDDGE
jgi:hypothetical protein